MATHAKKRLLFVCMGNSNRSQLAEAFARIHGGDAVQAYSAGVRPAASLDERAIAEMAQRGYELRTHRPKYLTEVPQDEFDAVIAMGCEQQCPVIAAKRHISWELPQGKNPDEYAILCREIEGKVKELLADSLGDKCGAI